MLRAQTERRLGIAAGCGPSAPEHYIDLVSASAGCCCSRRMVTPCADTADHPRNSCLPALLPSQFEARFDSLLRPLWPLASVLCAFGRWLRRWSLLSNVSLSPPVMNDAFGTEFRGNSFGVLSEIEAHRCFD